MDWIETFVKDTEGIQSPESFRLWTGISIIAGALERRVWTETGKGLLFPNLFILLSGAPASGKTLMVSEARNFWTEVHELHVGPDNPTKASFLHALKNSVRHYTNGSGAVIFSAMSMACMEFSVLFSKAESQFFGDMTALYDNPPQFSAPRTSTVSIVVDKPTVNILAGVTPDFLADLLPDSAWGQGFTSRLMFIYGAKLPPQGVDIFLTRPKGNKRTLQESLNSIFKIGGPMEWEGPAKEAINHWFEEDMPPVPDYGRLTHYVGRRGAHVIKLSMISAVSRSQGLSVSLNDFNRAREWLLQAELTMPDVFKSMRQKSDAQLIQDMHHWAYAQWSLTPLIQRKALKEEILWSYLHERTTSDKIHKLIETAYRSGLIRQGNIPGTFIPKPR